VYRDGELIAQPDSGVTSYDDTDPTLVSGGTYTYCVAVKLREGATGVPMAAGMQTSGPGGDESARVCDEGGAGLDPPGAVSASDTTYDDRIRVTWRDRSDFEDGYEISRWAFGDTLVVDTTRANVTLFDDFTAGPDTLYIYSVRAIHHLGGVSADSTDEGYRAIVLPPTDVQASDGTFEDRVDISWKSTSTTAVLFRIYRDDRLIKTVSSGDRLYQDYGGTAGLTCYYRVAAFTALGAEAKSRADRGIRQLRAPSPVTASDETHEEKIVVSWTDNSTREQGYVISRLDTVRIDSVSVYNSPGLAYGVTVEGSYAYIADRDSGLQVVDITTPESPVLVGSYDTPDIAFRIALDGNLAYVADHSSGVQVIDVTNPYSPVLIGSYDTPHTAFDVAIAGNYACIADEHTGLLVLDITRPDSLVLAGSYDTPGSAYGVAIAGNHAYVADGQFGVHVFDINRPESPTLVGTCDTPGLAFNVNITGRYAYVADQASGLQVIDISNPNLPVLVGSYDTPGGSFAVSVAGNYAYLADQNSGLLVVDVSVPEVPVLAGSYDTPGVSVGIAVADGYTYVADDASGLRVFQVDTGDTTFVGPGETLYNDYTAIPGVTYTYSVSAFDELNGTAGYSTVARDQGRRVLLAPTDVAADKGVSEQFVEVTWSDNSNAEDGYHIYRDTLLVKTTEGNYTSYVDTLPIQFLGQRNLYSVEAFDDYGESEAAADTGYTTILAPVSFNASDFYEDRIELTWVDRSAIEQGYRIYRDRSLLATLTGSDITSYTDLASDATTIIGSYDTPDWAENVAIAGNYAYVADRNSGLQVIDLSAPVNLTLAGSYDTPGQAYDVAVAGNFAYIADLTHFQVVDITTPESPQLAGDYFNPSFGAQGVSVAGGYAYVADSFFGLRVFDINDTENPQLVGSYDTPGLPLDVVVAGNHAYLADHSSLEIIDISNPLSPSLTGSYVTPGGAVGVAVDGSHAYVAGAASGLLVFDVSDPLNPALVGSYDTPGDASGVTVAGEYAYVADWDAGLQVIDITDPTGPVLAWTYVTPDSARGVAVADNFVCIADHLSGLQLTLRAPARTGVTYGYRVQAFNDALAANSHVDYGSVYTPDPPEARVTELAGKLLASDGAAGDLFGVSVSISGNRAIIGANYDQDNGSMSGSAYIFELNPGGTWTQKQKLLASDGAPNDFFGRSVSISGDWAVVGAMYDNVASGSAYVFKRNPDGTWGQPGTGHETQKLLASDGESYDYFGECVSISGDRVVVGARGDSLLTGAAYIYERNLDDTWGQPGTGDETQKLLASDGEYNDVFGEAVSISGDWIIIGAKGDADEGTFTGSAYIFERNPDGTWGQPGTGHETQKLLASDAAAYEKFGWCVAISGERAIIGAPYDGAQGDFSGSAYIFERNPDGTWGQPGTGDETQKLLASDGHLDDKFGLHVAITEGTAIVSSPGDDDHGPSSGSVYLFERDYGGTWAESQKFVASDGDEDDRFGQSVAISEGRALIGAPYDYDNGPGSGSAYITEIAASAYSVSATDGILKSRVRVTWDDRSTNERGFRIYRDGEAIASVEPNVEVYEDFDAQPGRTYEYGVATLKSDLSEELDRVTDFGWRPANGSITGRVSTLYGAAAEGVKVSVDPVPTKSLVFDGAGGHILIPDYENTIGSSTGNSYSIEAWIKYSGEGGSGV
ncbi:MAG: hypothetical protein PVF33_06640, partial [Candidatus Latescibacterota bacterium]